MLYNIRLSSINVYTKMVSSSSNTIRIVTAKLKANITAAKEQKHEEQNDIFFDRKIEHATAGLKSDCYKQN
jgi:hypothetical protein